MSLLRTISHTHTLAHCSLLFSTTAALKPLFSPGINSKTAFNLFSKKDKAVSYVHTQL